MLKQTYSKLFVLRIGWISSYSFLIAVLHFALIFLFINTNTLLVFTLKMYHICNTFSTKIDIFLNLNLSKKGPAFFPEIWAVVLV